MKLEITKIGDQLGIILPDELLTHLKWSAGDQFDVAESSDGSLQLTREDPHHAKVMAIARKAMVDYAETFKALAKS